MVLGYYPLYGVPASLIDFGPGGISMVPPRIRHICLTLLASALVLGTSFSFTGLGEPKHPVVTFGGDAHYPPFEWLDNGRARGFNIELADAVASAGGKQAAHQLGEWPDIVAAFDRGEIDVLPMFVTPQRVEKYEFTSPFYFAETTIFGAPDAPRVFSVEGLSGTRVSFEMDSHAYQRLQGLDIPIELVPVENTLESLQAVTEGKAQYALLSALVSRQLIRKYDLDLVQKGPPLWSHPYAFAVRRSERELFEWLDAAFDETLANGTYVDIYARWEDEITATPATWADVLRVTGWVGLAAVAALAVWVGWTWALTRQVARRTASLNEELERRTEAESQLRYLAQHDMQTGLRRRAQFIEDLDDLLKRRGSGAALELTILRLVNLGDLARFFGHAKQDEALTTFASRLARASVLAVSYFGGRTFAMITEAGQGRILVEPLAKPLSLSDSVEFDTRVTAGAAQAPRDGASAAELLRCAETALEFASTHDARYRSYEPYMKPDATDLEIVRDFRETEGSALYAAFQPQIELATGKFVAAEALVRWNHPILGELSPERFVRVIEHAGLISKLTDRVVTLTRECQQAMRAEGFFCPVSVNVTIPDLLESRFIDSLLRLLDEGDLDPNDITIELTENSFADDMGGANQALQRLREAGIRTSIDDFGTGYASLAYLSEFLVDEIKIDRKFVVDMCHNERHHAIVRSAVVLAHSLGLTVVAEGPEDKQTIQALRHAFCDRAQGYVVSKPLLQDDLIRLLRRGFGS